MGHKACFYTRLAKLCNVKLERSLNSLGGANFDVSCLPNLKMKLKLDHDSGVFDDMPVQAFVHSPHMSKASGNDFDSDTPRLHEALVGESRNAFSKATIEEPEVLDAHKTWKAVKKKKPPEGASELPEGANVLLKKVSGEELMLSQSLLIQTNLKGAGTENCISINSPVNETPLGTHADGEPFKEGWHCAGLVGMFMHHPEVQSAVHPCAKFTHCLKNSCAVAVK